MQPCISGLGTGPKREMMAPMQTRPPLSDPRILLATWFGAGYAPRAPGTVGSLAALPFGWFFADQGGWMALAAAVLVVTLLGIWAADGYIARAGVHDPGPVVIDEVAGQWLALLPAAMLSALSLPSIVAAFLLFRAFDILKPWPISWADRRLPGGLGVMADDVLAGIAAAALWYALYRFFPTVF